MPRKLELFEPALLSLEENEFVLAHLGETANVALHEMDDEGVNPRAIRPVLQRFTELEELQEQRGVKWAGYDAIKDSITRYLDWQRRSQDIQKDGGPRHPSQHVWDDEGAMHRAGSGADSSDMVRSEILDDGSRKTFSVRLRDRDQQKRANMPWVKGQTTRPSDSSADAPKDRIIAGKGSFICSICDEAIATFKKGNAASKNLARRKVQKHLSTARANVSRHRAVMRRANW